MDNRKRQKRFHHNDNNDNHLSSSMALTIPYDLVREILVRLPHLRHIIRCGSACRPWLSLATDRDFHRRFVCRHFLSATALFFQTHFDNPDGCWSEYDPNLYRIRYPDDANHRDDTSFKPFGDEDMIIVAIMGTMSHVLGKIRGIARRAMFRQRQRAIQQYFRGEVPLELYLARPDNCRHRCRLPPPPRGIDRLLGCGLVCYDVGRRFAAALFCEVLLDPALDVDPTPLVTLFSSEARRWGPLAAVGSLDGAEMLEDAAVAGLDGRLYWLVKSGCVMCVDATEAFTARIGACRGKIRLGAVVRGVLKVWDLTSGYDWSLVYEELIGVAEFRILALHPTNPDVVFVQFESIYVVRYDMSQHKGEVVGKYPSNVKRGVVSAYAQCLPSS